MLGKSLGLSKKSSRQIEYRVFKNANMKSKLASQWIQTKGLEIYQAFEYRV
jgi:hypothetical protein